MAGFMKIQDQLNEYINSLPDPKCSELKTLHQRILKLKPRCKLWYLDGKTKEFYQVGLSANTSGISVYIMGIADKTYLTKTYGKVLGKASVSGYCIKFKSLKEINTEILEAAIKYGLEPRG